MLEEPPLLRVTVRGASMNLAGLVDGQVVMADSAIAPANGDLVVAELGDEGTVIKRYVVTRWYGQDVAAWLFSESDEPSWQPLRLEEHHRVLGVVTSDIPGRRRPYQVFENPTTGQLVRERAELPPLLPAHTLFIAADAPPLARLVQTVRNLRRELDDEQLERSLRVPRGYLADIEAGWVPELKHLLRLGKRIEALVGKRVSEERLRELAAAAPEVEPPFVARRRTWGGTPPS